MIRKFIARQVCRMMEKNDAKSESGRVLPGGIDIVRDIPAPGGCAYDLYSPYGVCDLPLIVDVHGGGLMYGHKGLNRRLCCALAALGFNVADVEYRLAPEADFDVMIRDVCAAVKAAHERCGGQLFLAGDSAGALLALIADAAAVCDQVREAFELGSADVGCGASGLFLISGMYVFAKRGVRTIAGLSVGKGDWLKYTRMPVLLDVYTPPRLFMTSSGSDFLKRASLRFDRLLTLRALPHIFDYKAKDCNGHKYAHVYPVRDPEWQESADLLRRAAAYLVRGL